LDATLRLDPSHWRARSEKIDRLLSRGELAEAQRHIDILSEQLGERADVLMLQGRLQQLSGKPEAALALYQNSFEQTPNNISLMRQGSALVDLQRNEEAFALFDEWLEDHPEDAATLLELGQLYLQAGDLEEAEKVYARVAELTPGNAAALNNLAWLLIDRSPGKAVEVARAAVDLAPGSASFRDTYAMALRAAGDPGRARMMIDKVVAAAPGNSVFRYHRAQILNDLGDYEAALKDLSVILESGKAFAGREDAERLQRAISRGIAKK
jgi:tetratricopeptide (TPR) repeat protein